MSETRAVLEALDAAVSEGRPVVMATIVRAKGSTPRGVASRMVIEPEEGSVGTVGGGCGEAEVIEAAKEALEEGRPRVVTVELIEDLYSWSPAVCGGVFDVLLEPWTGSGTAA
ncbi:MAG: XdhC family protein [Gemmatimonadota bacterium]|nr:XdhC family protein [Gemmatimonadota bacterium]